MRIGIYGGSFNPIHNGHIGIVKFVLKKLELDKIIIVPVGIPSHRDDVGVTGEMRKKMCELAFEGEKKITVSDIEIKSKKISYTIDTLRKIIGTYGGHNEFYEIVGEDSADDFANWKEHEKILELSKVVVFPRKQIHRGNILDKNIIYLDTPLIYISSTKIRENIKKGMDISELVPEKVEKFIKENNLYK